MLLFLLMLIGCETEDDVCDPPGVKFENLYFRGEKINTLFDCEFVNVGCSNDASICNYGLLLQHKGKYLKCSAPNCEPDIVNVERWCDQHPECAW
jgi:hypothetical protein